MVVLLKKVRFFSLFYFSLLFLVFLTTPLTILVIISYSMPVGQKTKNGRYHFIDTSYSGDISNGFYKGGTGILTDGNYGSVNSKDSDGKGWVGWSSVNTPSPYIEIIFQFSGVRKFKHVTLSVNVDRRRSNAVFNKSQIFFGLAEGNFSKTFLQYCPIDFPAKDSPYNANITLSLCENTGSFVKMKLFFSRKWLLITEITFNSGICWFVVIMHNNLCATKI